MIIQGMGLIDTAVSTPTHYREHRDNGKESQSVEVKLENKENSRTADSLALTRNLEDLQMERAKLQQFLQNQKRSSRLMKHLLFLITPGMEKFVEKEIDQDHKNHLHAKA